MLATVGGDRCTGASVGAGIFEKIVGSSSSSSTISRRHFGRVRVSEWSGGSRRGEHDGHRYREVG